METTSVEHHSSGKRLNVQLLVIEVAVNHCWQINKDYKKKKQQEIKEDEDEDNSDIDLLYRDCPVYGSKKKYLEE